MADNSELLEIADKTFNSREYAAATELFKELVLKSELDGDSVVLVEALSMAARGHLIRGEKETGRPWLERAKSLADPKEPRGWSRYLGVRGRFESYDKKDMQASQTFKDMYAYTMIHKLYSRAIDAAHMVALTASHEEQILWAHKGIEAAEEGGQVGWLGPLWNNLGITYWNIAAEFEPGSTQAQENFLLAVDCYQQARIHHHQNGDEFSKTVADWALGSAYRRAGNLELAEEMLKPVLEWAEQRYAKQPSIENGEWVGLANMDLGLISMDRNQTKLARKQLNSAREKLGAADMKEWDQPAWDKLTAAIESLEAGDK